MMENRCADNVFYIRIFCDFLINGNKLIVFNQIIAVILCNGVVISAFVENEADFSFIGKLAER